MSLSVAKFARRLSETFPLLMREILRYENNYLTRGVITPPQFWALSQMAKQKTCQMHDLALCMNLKFSSATGLVDRLVKQRLVCRDRSKNDRRVVHVSITPKGRRIFDQICEQKRKGIAKLFSRLSASERARYLEIIQKLASNLSEHRP